MPNKKRNDESNKEVILGFLKKHPDEHVTTSEVVDATGLSRSQVTSSLHAMRRTMGPFVRRVGDAVWVYTPNPRGVDVANDRILYEEVGKLPSGEVVVRDQKGVLYEIKPLG